MAVDLQPRRHRCQRGEDDAPGRRRDRAQHERWPGLSLPSHRRPAGTADAPVSRRRLQRQHRHGRCGKHLPRLDPCRRTRDPCAEAERSPDADPEGAGRGHRGEDRSCAKRPGSPRLAQQRREPPRICANPAADGTLGTAQPYTVSGEKTREFDLDLASDGDATLVWTTPDAPPNTKVKARTLDFDSQTLSVVSDISAPPFPELSDTPLVAVDPAGNATIVWRHDTATASLTETRKLSAAGALSSTQMLTSPGFTSQAHDVVVDDAGNARVVWVEHSAGNDNEPFLPTTCISAVTSSCGARATLSNSPSLSATVAMGPAGDAMVGWADPAGTVRFLPRVGGAGGNGPTHVLSATARLPDLALDRAGDGIAVWRQGMVSKGAGFDAAPPKIKRISIPRVIKQGVRMKASARVFDVSGAAISWRFGDGRVARGRSVHHTYEHLGTFRVRVSAIDGAGGLRVASRSVRVKRDRRR